MINKKKKYQILINLGKKKPNLSKKYKKNKFLFKECQTNVWLYLKFKKKKLKFRAQSDSLIINGVLFLLIKIYNNKKPNFILNIKNKFLKKYNLIEILSINRYIGILNIIKKIKKKAYKKILKN